MKLRARQSNNIKDFVAASGTVGATHMCVLSSSGKGTIFRAMKFPGGPTATFLVESYNTCKSIRDAQLAAGVDPITDIMINKSKALVVTSDIHSDRYNTPQEKDQSGLDIAVGLLKGMHPAIDTMKTLKDSSSRVRRIIVIGREGLKTGGVIHLRTYGVLEKKRDMNGKVMGKGKGPQLQLLGPSLTLRPLRVEAGIGSGTVIWPPGVKPNSISSGKQRKIEHEVIQRMKKRQQQESQQKEWEREQGKLQEGYNTDYNEEHSQLSESDTEE